MRSLSAALSNQSTMRTGCFQFNQKSYPIRKDKYHFSVPKRQLSVEADLIINHFLLKPSLNVSVKNSMLMVMHHMCHQQTPD